MNKPVVSVIIATYNNESTVRRAIESALAQKGVSLEVVIVDDASNDATWEVVSAIDDARVKIHRLERNSGPSVARNKALDLATGEWIAVLDGDDAFVPERLMHLLRRVRDAKADIIVDNLEVHRETDGAVYPMFVPINFGAIGFINLARFIQGNQCFLGGGEALGYLKPVFSATFFRDHALRYDPNVRIGEDYRLMADALASGALCVIEPSIGYLYTARAGSISHRLSVAEIDLIIAGDQRFLTGHTLSGAAIKAQEKRTRRLRQARSFMVLVEAMKSRNIFDVLKAWLAAPLAPRHLWRAVWGRLSKFFPCLKRKD